MIKHITRLAVMSCFALSACKNEPEKLVTKSFEKDGSKCIVQQMPENFDGSNNGSNKENTFDYFRVIIDSKARLMDSSHVNYVNFGMENSIKKVASGDTLSPAFAQRIANGKKDNYEYVVAFQKSNKKNFEILISDEVFEMGLISIKF